MQLITVRTPPGEGSVVAQLAFTKGIEKVAISSKKVVFANSYLFVQDVVEIETATLFP